MTFFGAADLPVMLDTFGVSVVFGSYETKGLLGSIGEQALPGMAGPETLEQVQVTIQNGTLPGVSIGDDITVDGVDYQVRGLRDIEDGAFTTIECELA